MTASPARPANNSAARASAARAAAADRGHWRAAIPELIIAAILVAAAAVAGGSEPDLLDRLWACGLRYREFALANRHFYAIMFEAAIPRQFESEEVAVHAAASFDALVQVVDLAAAAGARVYPNTRPGPSGAPEPAREVGWGMVDFRSSPDEPALAALAAGTSLFEWPH